MRRRNSPKPQPVPDRTQQQQSPMFAILMIVGLLLFSNGKLDLGSLIKPGPRPQNGVANPAAVVSAVAARVEGGKITDTDELARLWKTLIEAGDLPSDYAAKFDAAFPGVIADPRKLTKEDAEKLRGIK